MADEEAVPNPEGEEEERERNKFAKFIEKTHDKVYTICEKRTFWKWFWFVLCHCVIIGYFIWATVYFTQNRYPEWNWQSGYGVLVLLLIFIYCITIYVYIYKPYLKEKTDRALKKCQEKAARATSKTWLIWIFYILVLAGILIYLIIDAWASLERLIAVAGFFVFILVGMIFSKHPADIQARPLFCGLFTQFFLGLLAIKWPLGRQIFEVLGKKISIFLDFADAGSMFAYGEPLVHPPTFAFKAMSVVFFLSFMVQILYYYGVIQKLVLALGKILHKIMGTTIIESVNAAANIFMGMTEAPLMLQPYLHELTKSELHAVMAAGFASVAGTVLAAYINYGANPAHLITASVLSAPAALFYSKIFYPETERSRSTPGTIKMPKSEAQGVLDAACRGASAGIELVLGIIANVIAFLSFITFVNALFTWFGSMIGHPDATIETILGYGFMPVAFIMGVPWNESLIVGQLIATKTMVNEFVAYYKLGELCKTVDANNNTQIPLTLRSEAIATYALCGFSNPGSVGIVISGMSILAPSKREDVMQLIWRSFMSGIMACFLTACIAGMLIRDEDLH